ncbi:hypothetical protein DNC80_09100 [Flavobacterium sp. SOK18b]|nr:hypothetical protein [Flavobacterium sp. SOK18b]
MYFTYNSGLCFCFFGDILQKKCFESFPKLSFRLGQPTPTYNYYWFQNTFQTSQSIYYKNITKQTHLKFQKINIFQKN